MYHSRSAALAAGIFILGAPALTPLASQSPLAEIATASAAGTARPVERTTEYPSSRPQDQSFTVTYSGAHQNSYGSIGLGVGLPGLVAFQAGFTSFGGVAPGLYMDLRLTGTTLGEAAFGTGSPLWQNSFEVDLRAGYGSMSLGDWKGRLRDSNNERVEARLPGSFGVTPYIGWRGRWGYRVQQFRLGLHVQRTIDVEAAFRDGRRGNNFNKWAFDFELSISGNEMKGLGAQAGFDQWLNQFIFLRYQLGYTHPNLDKFAPNATNHFSGNTEIGAGHGFTAMVLVNFAFQFNIPLVSKSNDDEGDGEDQNALQTREHERLAPTSTPSGTGTGTGTGATTGTAARTAATAQDDTRPRGATCETNADCSDGVFCNGEEICNAGTCTAGTLPDDDIDCTQLVCDEQRQQFRFEPLHGLCGDGNFCNGTERCDLNLGCVAGNPVPVDDVDPCTRDYCDEDEDRVINDPIAECSAETLTQPNTSEPTPATEDNTP